MTVRHQPRGRTSAPQSSSSPNWSWHAQVTTIHQRLRDDTVCRPRSRRCAATSTPSSPRSRLSLGAGAARYPGPAATRRRWTSVCSVAGATRRADGCGGCGASSWCSPSAACSCARCSDGPNHLGRVSCVRLRILRGGRRADRARQPEAGGDHPRPLRPIINKAYADSADFYGCLIDPARRREPTDKVRRRTTGSLCGGTPSSPAAAEEFTDMTHMQRDASALEPAMWPTAVIRGLERVAPQICRRRGGGLLLPLPARTVRAAGGRRPRSPPTST